MTDHNQTEPYDTPGADAVDLAFSWLSERHEEELDHAIDGHFFFGLRESQRNRLAKLPEPMQVMIDVSGREQVVAEGILHLPAGSITCLDLLLGPDGPELAPVQRHYLEALARPIYRVVETKPNGLLLRDLLDDRETERWVAEPLASMNFAYQPGKALSGRLIPGDPWHFARALYPTGEPMLSFLLDQIRAEFSRRELHRRVTTELVAAWGNLCHRVLGFAHRRFAGTVPAPGALRGADETLLGRNEAAFEAVGAQLEAVRLRAALRAALAVVHEANAYLTERAPWQRIASDPVDAATSVYTALRVIDNLKTLLSPFLPFSSQRLHEQLGQAGRLFGETRIETAREATREHPVLTYDDAGAVGRWRPSELAAGQQLGPCAPLFVKLDQLAEAD